MHNIKVAKFGGSSLADAEQFRKVADIIHADNTRRYVVVSAPGKRYPGDKKVTDMLYDCYDKAARGEAFEKDFKEIEDRFNSIIKELRLDISLEEEFRRIKYLFAHCAGRDYAASRGEYLNAILLAKFLGLPFIDTVGLVCFNECGIFDLDKTLSKLSPRLSEVERAVLPGFYGSMPNDTIKTFSRGGSDISGSIVASAVNADIYENWTDVSGFMVCDPRLVKDTKPITTITYRELRELSYMGASVLHEEAIFPVRAKGIPINIRNTNNPEEAGTMIVSQTDEKSSFTITGIAGKRGFSTIYIEKAMMNTMVGFGRQVLRVLEKNNICFEHMPSGIDTLSIVLSTDAIKGKEKAVIDEIIERTQPDHIEIENDLALIAVVGRGMKKAHGTAARVFAALSGAGINVKMIDQGSSELNIIIGVSEEDFEEATRAIYHAFV